MDKVQTETDRKKKKRREGSNFSANGNEMGWPSKSFYTSRDWSLRVEGRYFLGSSQLFLSLFSFMMHRLFCLLSTTGACCRKKLISLYTAGSWLFVCNFSLTPFYSTIFFYSLAPGRKPQTKQIKHCGAASIWQTQTIIWSTFH